MPHGLEIPVLSVTKINTRSCQRQREQERGKVNEVIKEGTINLLKAFSGQQTQEQRFCNNPSSHHHLCQYNRKIKHNVP